MLMTTAGESTYPCTTARKGRFHIRHDRSRSPSQRTGIHGVRTVIRPQADGGGCLRPCPGARRNLGFSRGPLLRALLFRAEGRERQDRGGDLEGRPQPDAFQPQEGLEVIATGKLTTYPGSSKYQIVIEVLEPAGVGALMALMEARKKKLAAEGLF